MCAPFHDPDHALVARAVDTADAILARAHGVRMAKAAGIGSPGGFVRAVARLAGILGDRAAPVQEAATRAAGGEFVLDWRALAPRARTSAIDRAARAARAITTKLPPRVQSALGAAAVDVVGTVRREMRERGLAVGVDFNAVDRRVVDHVVRSHTNFVRDAMGRRVDSFSAKAREVVADGLDRGLGNDEIARELGEAARGVLQGKSPFYWEVVASAFTGQARSYAHVSAFAEAGIERYRILAVMDAHTTPICRFMNGRVFSVRRALDRFDAIDQLDGPEDIKNAAPWAREARDPRTGAVHIYVRRGETSTRLATYASGTPSRIQAAVSDEALEGVFSSPPFHALCRSTVVSTD